MSAISLKSITGITSITTPAGVDNQLTLHTNNTTERVKIDVAGNVHVNNHLSIAGVTTFTGAITANSTLYVGSDLTITEKLVHNGDPDTYLQFTPNTINLHSGGTTGLTVYDTNVRIPTKLGINGAVPSTPLDVIANSSGYAMAIRGRSSDNIGEIRFTSNDYGSALYSSIQTGDTYLNIQVGSVTNALRIDSSGRLLVGRTSAYAHVDADNLIVGNEATNEHQGITILSHSGKYGGIYFGDGAGTNPNNRCKIIYDHPNDQLRIGTAGNAATQFYLNSSGYVGVNVSPSARLDVKQNNGVAYDNRAQSIAYGAARFLNESGHTSGGTYTGYQFNITGDSQNRICSIGMITEASNSRASSLVFATDDNGNRTEKLRITSDGKFGFNKTDPDNDFVFKCGTGAHTVLQVRSASESTKFTIQTVQDSDVRVGTLSDHPLNVYTNSLSRVHIHDDGWCMLNTSTLGSSKTAKELIISYNNDGVSGGDQGRAGMTIRSGNNSSNVIQNGYIYFSDGTSGDNESKGGIVYEHSNDALYFATNNIEKLRITSGGSVNIGGDYTSTTSRLRINSTSYPETTEYLAVFKAGVANGNRFKNRYIKIRNNYTGSIHGGVPIVWEANADGSNNKAYGAVVTEGNGDIRFLNAAATSEKAIGTDLLSTISEKLRITKTGEMGLGSDNPPTGSFTIRLTETPEFNLYSTQHAQNNNCKINFGVGQSASVSGNTGARIEMNIPNTGGQMTGELKFHTNSGDNLQERLRITSEGDMGLGTGTNTVTQRLDVRESNTAIFNPVSNLPTIARLYNTSAVNGASAGLQLRADNNNGAAGMQYIHCVNSSTNYSSDLVFSRRLATSGSYAEQLRITNKGRLLIGTSTENSTGSYSSVVSTGAVSNNGGFQAHYNSGTQGGGSMTTVNAAGGGLSFWTYTGGLGSESYSQRLRIDGSTGDIMCYYYQTLFSQTGLRIYNNLSGGPQLAISRSSGNPMLLNRNTTDGEIVDLRRGWGAGGSIHVGTNSATYNTSSDYRLKENIVPISDGITRLKTLKPSRFNWIGDTSSTRDGFIAHEVTAVPEAITGTKDEVYSEDEPDRNIKAGDPKYQGIDQARLVPLLTAALQEAIAKIETLENKVATLEGS